MFGVGLLRGKYSGDAGPDECRSVPTFMQGTVESDSMMHGSLRHLLFSIAALVALGAVILAQISR